MCIIAMGSLPTCVDFVYESSNMFVCSFNSPNCALFDLEFGKEVLKFDTDSEQATGSSVSRQINKVYLIILIFYLKFFFQYLYFFFFFIIVSGILICNYI